MLDLNMPGMNGFEVLEWIRQQPDLRNLFVVVLSGMDDTKSVARAYRLGANSYLTKPVKPYDLANMAQFFRGYWTVSEPKSEYPEETWHLGEHGPKTSWQGGG